MNARFRLIIVPALVLAVVAASALCCCLPDTAQAAERVPACHQTSGDADAVPGQPGEDCSCPHMLNISSETATNDFQLTRILYRLASIPYPQLTAFVPPVAAYQAPPDHRQHPSPLYLQNAVLRI